MIQSGSQYHQQTEYSRRSLGGHALNWANRPDVIKSYPDLPTVSLPRSIEAFDIPYPAAFRGNAAPAGPLNLDATGRILHHACGVTGTSPGPGFPRRSVPSAGALFPAEVYTAVGDSLSLPAGLYHYNFAQHELVRLRAGDFRQLPIFQAEARDPAALYFITAIFYRSAWKYRDRAYRYCLLDAGHVVESLLTALSAAGRRAGAVYDFPDEAVNEFLGLDPGREVCLAVVFDGAETAETTERSSADPPPLEALSPSIREASRTAPREPAERTIPEEAHRATIPGKQPESPPNIREAAFPAPSEWVRHAPPASLPADLPGYTETVERRKSHRNFTPSTLKKPYFDALLNLLQPESGRDTQLRAVATAFLVQNVEDLQPGVHVFRSRDAATGLIRSGGVSRSMAGACLNQDWLANAALHVCFVTDLTALETAYGSRGYRHAELTAGRLGHRLYLAAAAFGLGCCGIGAYFDAEAAAVLGLSDTARLLYLVAWGPVKRAY